MLQESVPKGAHLLNARSCWFHARHPWSSPVLLWSSTVDIYMSEVISKSKYRIIWSMDPICIIWNHLIYCVLFHCGMKKSLASNCFIQKVSASLFWLRLFWMHVFQVHVLYGKNTDSGAFSEPADFPGSPFKVNIQLRWRLLPVLRWIWVRYFAKRVNFVTHFPQRVICGARLYVSHFVGAGLCLKRYFAVDSDCTLTVVAECFHDDVVVLWSHV